MRPAAGLLVAGLLACSAPETPVESLTARVSVDRIEARVGDRIGVTIDVETPRGWALERPASPTDPSFSTESLELIAPREVPGGLRHTLLWTVRAREVGDAALPMLEVPLGRPDGELQRLSVGGVPLPVRSVRDELPGREVYFDIRPAPPRERDLGWVWGAGSLALLLAGLFFFALHRRRTETRAAGPPPDELARRALDALEAALGASDPRLRATALEEALLGFAAARWQLETGSLTPRELPAEVDPALVDLLVDLETARFVRAPAEQRVARTAETARAWLRHVAFA